MPPLFVDEILYSRVNKDEVRCRSPTHVVVWVGIIQAQRTIQVGQFSLDARHKAAITRTPFAFHHFVPPLNSDGVTLCFEIHTHSFLPMIASTISQNSSSGMTSTLY